jgi:hypothetical protein
MVPLLDTEAGAPRAVAEELERDTVPCVWRVLAEELERDAVPCVWRVLAEEFALDTGDGRSLAL